MKLTLPPSRPFKSKREQRRLYEEVMGGIAACDNDEQLDALLAEYADDLATFAACEALPEAVKHHHGFDWYEALRHAIKAQRNELARRKEFDLCY